jgi:outer membrane protein OmpA-like peptidoglycan-associated protein
MSDRTRFAFDAGIGFEFTFARQFGVGPIVRYGHVVASASDYPSDAQFITVGVSFTFRLSPDRRPEADDDHDGVRNDQDQCPDEPPGLHPDPHRPGCPIPDRDHDNVPDERDACPDLPGSPSTDPARNGCSGLVRLDQHQLRITRTIRFAPNSDELDPESDEVLRSVADAIRATPRIHRVSVDGHTDDVGDDGVNQQLSQRRAEAVRARLIQLGVEPGRLEAHGYGESRPLVHATTPAARTANRRVEFRITDPSPP